MALCQVELKINEAAVRIHSFTTRGYKFQDFYAFKVDTNIYALAGSSTLICYQYRLLIRIASSLCF